MFATQAASSKESASEATPAVASSSAPSQQHEEDDKEECPWCRWMKAGGCREQFQTWMNCVDAIHDAGRKDVESCATVMLPLFTCMQANSEYYQPQLDTLEGRQLPDGSIAGEKASTSRDTTAAASASASAGDTGKDHSQVSSALGLGAKAAGNSNSSTYADVDDVSEEDLECIIQAWEQQDAAEAEAGAGAKAT